MGRVYAVASAKGGVGKTTTTANLGVALAAAGHDVVVVDADLGMPNLGAMLDVAPDGPTLHDVLAGEAAPLDALSRGPRGLRVLPGDSTLDAYAGADPRRLDAVLDALSEFDVVLLDTGAGLSHDTVLPLGLADSVVLVSTATTDALGDTAKTRQLAERLDVPVLGLVATRVDADRVDVASLVAEFDADPLGAVPEDRSVGAESSDAVVTARTADSPAAAAYRALAATLAADATEAAGEDGSAAGDGSAAADSDDPAGEGESGESADPAEDAGSDAGDAAADPADEGERDASAADPADEGESDDPSVELDDPPAVDGVDDPLSTVLDAESDDPSVALDDASATAAAELDVSPVLDDAGDGDAVASALADEDDEVATLLNEAASEAAAGESTDGGSTDGESTEGGLASTLADVEAGAADPATEGDAVAEAEPAAGDDTDDGGVRFDAVPDRTDDEDDVTIAPAEAVDIPDAEAVAGGGSGSEGDAEAAADDATDETDDGEETEETEGSEGSEGSGLFGRFFG